MLIKKCFILILSLSLLITGTIIPCHASSNSELGYAIETVESRLSKESYVPVENVYLSNAHPLYDFDSNNTPAGNLYFVFDGNRHIGTLLVYLFNNQYVSTFTFESHSEIETALQNGSRVSFGRTNGCFLMFIGSTMHIIENTENVLSSSIEVSTSNIQSNTISASTVLTIAPSARSIYYFLPADIVPNSSVNGVGICWAAALASKINFQTDSDVTAEYVYFKCWNEVGNSPDDIPVGNDRWYQIGALIHGIYLTMFDGPLNKQTIGSALSEGKPIIISVQDIRDSQTTYSHALLLCGFDEDADYYELAFVDSNKSNYVYLTFPHSVLNSASNFYYQTGSRVYTQWSRSRY